MKNKSLQKKLNRWIIIASAIFSLLAAVISGIASFYEAKDSQDVYLTQIGDLVKQGALSSGMTTGGDDEDDETLIIQCLQQGCQKRLVLPAQLSSGFHTLTLNHVQWRILLLLNNQLSKNYAIAQRTQYRDELATDSALLSFLAVILLAPLLMALVHLIIRHNFKPLHKLSDNVNQRSETDFTPLSSDNIPKEVLPFILSINQLLKRTELTLNQQKRFVADAAHELRTPLTALSLLSENAMQSFKENNLLLVKQRLESLQHAMKRMKNLVSQLLNLARMQGTETSQFVEVNIRTIIQDTIADLHPLAEEKNIDIGVTNQRDIKLLDSEGGLAILFHNAIDNAIRYSPKGGKIDISLTKSNETAMIEIKDNGIGINENDLDRVFEPFYRTNNNPEQGNGLGLAICQEVANKLQGKIILKNHQDGGLLFIYMQRLSHDV